MYSNQRESVIKGVIKKTGASIPYAIEALSESKWDRDNAIDYIKNGKKKSNKHHAKG